jgi:FkbM family methyltransferase
MIRYAPQGKHMAFEPLPDQFHFLQNQFGQYAEIFPYALSNETGRTTFHHVRSNPTYSGIREREYKGPEQVDIIEVDVRKLDDIVDPGRKIRLIKMDVEGAEWQVLKGSVQLLNRDHPYIIFEHGLGASDRYHTTPAMMYELLVTELGYQIMLMEDFLTQKDRRVFSKAEFEIQYYQKKNCYFLAVPAAV